MKSRYKQVGKDSFIYGLGGVLGKVIGFFLLPVYTRIFSVADYGIIDMLRVINQFLITILEMGMDAAQSFYFFEQKKKGKDAQARVVTAVFQWRLIWGIVVVGIALFFSPLINAAFFNKNLTWVYFVIAFIGCFFAVFTEQSENLFRLLYRPWSFISITTGQVIISAVIVIVLVLCFKWGVISFFIGGGVSFLFAAVIGWFFLRSYLDWSAWHCNWWPKLVRFGAPLIPSGLGMYVLTTSDRWFINHYHGQEMLGLYAVGAKFAALISLIVNSFRQAWWPIALDAMQSTDGPIFFRTMARLYLALGSSFVVLLTALSPLLVRYLTGPTFHAAYPVVGILSWYSIFFGFYLICIGGIWKEEKTIFVPFIMGSAVLFNIVLDIWLVPRYGGMGAALATSASFLLWNIITLMVSEKFWPVGYNLGILGLQVCVGAGATAGILILYAQKCEIWKVAVLTTSAVALLISLAAKPSHFKLAYQYIKRCNI